MMPTPHVEQRSDHSSNSTANDLSRPPQSSNGSWFARYRVLEFSVSIAMILVAGVFALISVHMRDIPHVEVRISATQIIHARDPSIDQKKMKEQVPMVMLVVGATGVPILANLFVNYVLPKFKRVRVIPHDTRDFLLSLAQSTGISQVLTQFVKNMTGRFRPSFYDMCKWNYDVVWDGKTNLCRDSKMEKEGRRSFPSGHASYAWCTLFLLTLYLMGRSRLNCENRDETILRGGRKTLKLFLCFLPTLVAAWVAVTRSVDNWHHYTDIVAGSIIGAFAAGFGYSYNYGSIFNWESAGVPYQEFHVLRKKKDRELQDASQALINSNTALEMEPRSLQSHSTSNVSYTTAMPPRTTDSISINITNKRSPTTTSASAMDNGATTAGENASRSASVSSADAVLPRWLPYERDIVEELYTQNDGLLVMARGLGVQRLLAYFLRLYASPKTLVLCLNVSEQVPLFTQLVLSLGLDRKFLPKVLDAKSSITEREQLYRQGGCFFVTSRVLVVDLLNKKLDASKVTGLLVHDAHRVTETSIEAFIIRLYREVNREGFIKAFTDDTSALAGGFNKMEQVLKHLYVRHVMLYPRFHVAIHASLEKKQPDVYEIEVSFSPRMKVMQQAILVAMEATMKELQRSTKALDAAELTMDRALSKSFGTNIRRQLDPVWHKLPPKTKQLVGDLTTLRQLLSYVPRYDAISYYSFLVNYQTMNGQQRFPSPWLFTEAADRLVTAAKERLYQIVDKTTQVPFPSRRLGAASDAPSVLKTAEMQLVLEGNPKWDALVQILDDVYEDQAQNESDPIADRTAGASSGAQILIMVKDERTCAQLREFLALGEHEMMRRRFGAYLVQREASIRKKGGPKSGLGAEQQLLLDAAAQFRAKEAAFHATASHAVHATAPVNGSGGGKNNSKKTVAGKGKKRMIQETTGSAAAASSGPEIASFGMSVEELQALTAVDDARARNKRQLLSSSTTGTASTTSAKAPGLSLELVDRADQVVLCTYDQAKQHGHGASALLQDVLPSYVVLYDPDMAFIRELEVFHATREPAGAKLEIYFMMYDESAEQQTYLSEIQREKKAFETLIYQKSHLLMPANVYDVPFHVKAAQQLQNQHPYSMDTRTMVSANTTSTSGTRTTRLQRPGVQVVVDVREFRSALPSMLHKDGLLVLPVTLEIGDYILSPQICVERKSISDLFGSLNSGRLFNQAENMGRYYELPVLLIEFSQGKAFSLQDVSEIGSEINASNIVSKLTLLVLHFPNLRILWSRSPHATVDLFKAIKKNQPEPDLHVAQAIGTGASGTSTSTSTTTGGADGEDGLASSYYNTNSMDVLRKLPGINDHNYRKVLSKVRNLAELCTLSLDELNELIGKVCAKKLFTFFNSGI